MSAPDDEKHVPAAKVQHRKFSVIWIIPLITAALAILLVYRAWQQSGPTITISFPDGQGLARDKTVLKYRGVEVGKVESIRLSPDQKSVLVEARMDKSATELCRESTVFWIVRPEISAGAISGLETIVSGPYIQIAPGEGKPQREFVGARKAPPNSPREEGLLITLLAPRLGTLGAGSPVFYRGIPVGSVQSFSLSTNSRDVSIQLLIEKPYVPLVRRESKFWDSGGINFDWGLFSGAQVRAKSLQTLVSGGIAFATPDEATHGPPVSDGLIYRLYDKPKDEWLEWSPEIPLDLEP